MDNQYKINDLVWWANCETKKIHKTCPVCFGNLKVKLVLGNGDEIETPCDFCGRGYEGPRGYLTDWEWVAEPKIIIIEGVEIEETSEGKKIKYRALECYCLYQKDLFSTKEEAELRCQERIKEHELEEKTKLEHSKEYNHKSYSWHVGYHLRQIKDHKRQLEWHEKRAIFCKKLSKDIAGNKV